MKSPCVFDEWFKFTHEIHIHSTRSGADVTRESYFAKCSAIPSLTLHTKGSHNSYGGKMIKVSGPILWNSLPEKIQKSTSIHTFKKYLKLHLIGKYGNNEN
jgi:hypothetical protein